MRHIARRALHGTIVGTLVAGLLITAVPASAHPSTPGETDAQHAATDLVGTPMSQIEAETKANAARIARATGLRPGRRSTAAATSQLERAATAAAVDPGVGGKWSSVVTTPVVPIFDAVLPNGKVLMWDSVGDGAAESYPDQTFTRAAVWTPSTNTSKRVDVVGYNIFCAGFTQLANGNVLVAGGNKDQQLNGIVQTHIFNWQTETWSRGPDMAEGRWYPAVTALANGEAAIYGGGPQLAEVYQTDNTLRTLTGGGNYGDRIYPFMLTRPDAQLQMLGPYTRMLTVNTTAEGRVNAIDDRDGLFREYGSFATYDIGKTLVAGGGNLSEEGQDRVPTRTATVVDTNGYYATAQPADPMATRRRQFNLTALADGTVLATGGETSAASSGLVDLQNAAFAAEQWNPGTGAWTTLASASRVRQYHSAATLLPDGRVLTGGGGVCGICTTVGYLEKNVEYFTPPYLYKKDGSGQLATRPVISGGSTSVTVGARTFTVTTAQAASIAKVGMVRLGAPTHGDDQGQRYIPLTFTATSTGLTVDAPVTAGVAPPGYYMVFIVDGNGVPSKARIVKVNAATVANPIRYSNVGAGTCLDIRGGKAVVGSVVQTYRCTTATYQRFSYDVDHAALSGLGLCLHAKNDQIAAGARVDAQGCDPTESQQWEQRPADGTIRSVVSPTLCLGPVGGSSASSTPLELQTCSGAASQRWRWW